MPARELGESGLMLGVLVPTPLTKIVALAMQMLEWKPTTEELVLVVGEQPIEYEAWNYSLNARYSFPKVAISDTRGSEIKKATTSDVAPF